MATYIKTLIDNNGDVVIPRITKNAIQDELNEVPEITPTVDEGKFLRVVNDTAVWATVPAAESQSV